MLDAISNRCLRFEAQSTQLTTSLDKQSNIQPLAGTIGVIGLAVDKGSRAQRLSSSFSSTESSRRTSAPSSIWIRPVCKTSYST
ncbi:hypothetical protein QCA50_008817 [Cerrena zonata]|uniref:Uncharacterized protein n=1 Tax=Cerrena zonata TaxID=2478898 RepID=A0AAW0GCD6_9APHY